MAALAHQEPATRIVSLDELRGFTLLSMAGFHTCYDLVYLYGVNLELFSNALAQDVWRCSVSWTFILLAGWMTSLSRNNLKRAGVYGGAALVVWVVTTWASVDTAVSFGILYCMAACTMAYVVLGPLLKRVPPGLALTLLLALFALTYGIPRVRYDVTGLAWLGFPSPSFSSGDYYPLIPYVFLYLAGAVAALWHRQKTGGAYPAWMCTRHLRPLAFLGRHSLIIYLLHQPLILAGLEVLRACGVL